MMWQKGLGAKKKKAEREEPLARSWGLVAALVFSRTCTAMHQSFSRPRPAYMHHERVQSSDYVLMYPGIDPRGCNRRV